MESGQSPLVTPESAMCHLCMLDGKIEDKEFGKVEESPHTFKQEWAHVAWTRGQLQVAASLLYRNESIARAFCGAQQVSVITRLLFLYVFAIFWSAHNSQAM